ncbi:hypothetical protein AX17_004560 [Amanita inopinata Kibby_2008]|nr:hypothetical protein AX17_004560 [Amanita inopinata Kibby_2008]
MSGPDVNIFPHATGAAQRTVEEHQDPQDLTYYSGWFCPFAQRGWIALEEREIPYQYKEVNPYKKEKHFLEINPKGLVPAIEFKGKALYESLIVCEFLEDAYPDHSPHLLSPDPCSRAYARIWIDYITKNMIPGFYRVIQSQEKEKQDAALQELYKALRAFSEEIKGPYFLGDEFSLVDVAIAPWIVRDYLLEEYRGYTRDAVGEAWKKYAEVVEKRESVVKTGSLKDNYTETYGRYLRNDAQSEVAKAIREGRALP